VVNPHNTAAMTLFVIAIDGGQWNQMFDKSLDGADVQAIAADADVY
jgi:hypothetical protein